MADSDYEKNQTGGAERLAGAERGGARTIVKEWLNFLGNVKRYYLANQKENKEFSPEDLEQIRSEARDIWAESDRRDGRYRGSSFARERSRWLKEETLSQEVNEVDWQLLRILFNESGKGSRPSQDYVKLAIGAREIMEVTGIKRDPRSQISFSQLLLGIHREFRAKLDALREKAKDPEAADRLAEAQVQDGMIEGYLRRIPDEKLWNELYKVSFASKAGLEMEFEKKLTRPKTPEEIEAELARLREEMAALWGKVGGPENENSGIPLDEALPKIKGVLSLQADAHNLELDAKYAREDPEYQEQELQKQFAAGTIDADQLEEGFMKIGRTMSMEKRRATMRLAVRQARLYRDAIPMLDEKDEETRRMKINLRLCEIMARALAK